MREREKDVWGKEISVRKTEGSTVNQGKYVEGG